MRFGINSFLFVSPFVTQSTRLFSKFKKWGFDTVELPIEACLLYTSPSPRDRTRTRMPSSA